MFCRFNRLISRVAHLQREDGPILFGCSTENASSGARDTTLTADDELFNSTDDRFGSVRLELYSAVLIISGIDSRASSIAKVRPSVCGTRRCTRLTGSSSIIASMRSRSLSKPMPSTADT